MVNVGLWDVGHKTWEMEKIKRDESCIRHEKME
jgi:hypothetical protein